MPFTYIPEIVWIVLVFIIGTCIGSFLNVLIYRIPAGIQFVKGNSFCPNCGKQIMPYDLIPIVSYLILRGKCRHCSTAISVKYVFVELLTGAVAVFTVCLYGYGLTALIYFGVFAMLIVIAFIDIAHMIIPDGLVIGIGIAAVINAVWDMPLLPSRIGGFFILSIPMFVLTLLIEDAFGFGDIKLIAVCGFMLGIKLILFAGFIAVILGGFHGVFVKYLKRDKNTVHIAFGQYICIGVFAAMTVGEGIIQWYISMLIMP